MSDTEQIFQQRVENLKKIISMLYSLETTDTRYVAQRMQKILSNLKDDYIVINSYVEAYNQMEHTFNEKQELVTYFNRSQQYSILKTAFEYAIPIIFKYNSVVPRSKPCFQVVDEEDESVLDTVVQNRFFQYFTKLAAYPRSNSYRIGVWKTIIRQRCSTFEQMGWNVERLLLLFNEKGYDEYSPSSNYHAIADVVASIENDIYKLRGAFKQQKIKIPEELLSTPGFEGDGQVLTMYAYKAYES